MSGLGGSFRDRLRSLVPMEGIVVRTPTHHVVERQAAAPAGQRVDVLMLDAEHAPLDLATLDAMLAVGSALDVPCLVRVPELTRQWVQQSLDLGATGIVVPHVQSSELAGRAVHLAHFGPGGRGFSPSTRSAGWGGRAIKDVIEAAAMATTVVVQVEDAEAVDVIDELVAVAGVDAVFVGPIDLTVSLGASSPDDERVIDACTTVADACRRAGMPLAAFATTEERIARWRELGATLLFTGSDQSGRIQGPT